MRSLSRNLFKAGWVTVNDDTRVIDCNELLERRIKEEEQRRNIRKKNSNTEEEEHDGFEEGLNAENVEALLDPDSEAMIQKSSSMEEREQLAGEIEKAKEELEQLRQQAEVIMNNAQREAEALKTGIMEQARQDGFLEGQQQAQALEEDLERQHQDKIQELELSYQKRAEELEPAFIDSLTDIYEHIFKVDLSGYRDLVSRLLIDAVLHIDHAQSIIVHVSKEDYAEVRDQKEDILTETGMMAGNVEIIMDATLSPSQCMIETESGVYDCSLETELHELKQKLMLLAYHKSN